MSRYYFSLALTILFIFQPVVAQEVTEDLLAENISDPMLDDDSEDESMIATQDPVEDESEPVINLVTKEFKIKYQPSSVVAVEVEPLLTPMTGTLSIDRENNMITISDTLEVLEEAQKIIDKFDQKEREIYLEARIVQIILNDENHRGVDWEAALSNYHNLNINGSKKTLSLGLIEANNYDALLEALDTVGIINELSRPNVTIANRSQANLMMSLVEPYVFTFSASSIYDQFVAHNKKQAQDQMNFIVSPKISVDGSIIASIKSEHNLRKAIEALTNKSQADEDDLELNLKEGQSIVIGGLLKSQRIEKLRKIPLLGDLPIVGFAFRNPNQLMRRTEFVLLLTPKVIDEEKTDQ